MRISDWSSDVCSSDLPLGLSFANGAGFPGFAQGAFVGEHGSWNRQRLAGYKVSFIPFTNGRPAGKPKDLDRKSVVEGKSVSVRVDLGGGRIIKKKKIIYN